MYATYLIFYFLPMTIPTLKRMIVFEPNINIYLTQYVSITPKSDNICIYIYTYIYYIYIYVYVSKSAARRTATVP